MLPLLALRAQVTRVRLDYAEHLKNLETMRVRKDGTVFPVLVTYSPIHNADRVVIGVSVTAREWSELRQASELSRSMIEASLDSMVSISPGGKITHANEAALKLTGLSRDKLIGSDFSHHFTDPKKAEEIYERAFTDGSVNDYLLTVRHQNSHETLVEVRYNAAVYRDISGSVLGVFAAGRDVSKQMQARRETAEQQARELDGLADLQRYQRLTVGRELKMIELKKEIELLRKFVPEQRRELD
jgi:PAS domain S-box-containing protein